MPLELWEDPSYTDVIRLRVETRDETGLVDPVYISSVTLWYDATKVYDLGFETFTSYLKAKQKAKNGEFADPHFGYRIYDSMCEELRENDCSVGLAMRHAKNEYIELDADWLLWWSPPLVKTGDMIEDAEYYKEMSSKYQQTASDGPEPMMKNKYTSYQEYVLFGDPAFNPYEPVNSG